MIIKDQIIYAMGENKETAVRVPRLPFTPETVSTTRLTEKST